jgi:hypothetical protein
VAKTGPAALSEETNPLRKLRRMQEAGCACLCARGRGSVFVFVFHQIYIAMSIMVVVILPNICLESDGPSHT